MVRLSYVRSMAKEHDDDVYTVPSVISYRRHIGLTLGWDDMHDGFARTQFSRNKNLNARIHKIKKSKLPGFRDTIRAFDWDTEDSVQEKGYEELSAYDDAYTEFYGNER